MSDIDNLLDGTLDDLADLPEFKPFPNGAHKATIKFERKEINKHPSVEVTLVAQETLELVNTSDTPLEKGAEASVAYMLDNDIGQGKFKELLLQLAGENAQGKKLSQLMEDYQNADVAVVTSKRPNKEKTREFMDITSIQLA
jgi:hypothetical protein